MRLTIILAILLCAAHFGRAADYPTTLSELKKAFDRIDSANPALERLQPSYEQPGVLAWGESYRLMAYVYAYEGTGDAKYLDRLTWRFDKILALRDDRFGRKDVSRDRVMKAWGSTKYTGGVWHCWLVHAGMITFPAARFVRLVYENPRELGKYRSKADEYLRAIQETVSEYDEEWHNGPGVGEGYYSEAGTQFTDYLPLNQMNAMGQTLFELYRVTHDKQHLSKAVRLAQFFKNRIKKCENGAYDWSYKPPIEPGPSSGEDVSHAAINVSFAEIAYENGAVFKAEDMQAFAATFTKNICRPDGSFASNVSGDGDLGSLTTQLARWAGYARYSPDIGNIVLKSMFSEPRQHGDVDMLGLAYLMRNWRFSDKDRAVKN